MVRLCLGRLSVAVAVAVVAVTTRSTHIKEEGYAQKRNDSDLGRSHRSGCSHAGLSRVANRGDETHFIVFVANCGSLVGLSPVWSRHSQSDTGTIV